MTDTVDREQHCVRCGRGVGDANSENGGEPTTFRSPHALKCDHCNGMRDEERRSYHRVYHRARGRALSRLVDLHPRQFERLLAEEREKIEEEEAAKERRGQKAG